MASNQPVGFSDAEVKDKILWVDNFTTVNGTVTQNPAVPGQSKATILGCDLFANGSEEDITHWWQSTDKTRS